MLGLIEQRVDLDDGHAFRPCRDLHDLVAGRDLALFQDTEIETGSALFDQQRGHPWLVHANADPITGDARLRHLEQCASDPIAISDAHRLVRQALDGEVLPELPIGEVMSTELFLPIPVRVDLINEDGPVLAAVTRQVALPVAVDIEPPHPAAAFNGCLPDGGMDTLAAPRNVARQAHVDREQTYGHVRYLPLDRDLTE